jgi:hypothetical protein
MLGRGANQPLLRFIRFRSFKISSLNFLWVFGFGCLARAERICGRRQMTRGNFFSDPQIVTMTQPTKREQLAAMRPEDFKAHLRTIAGEDPKQEIRGARRPNPLLVRNRRKPAKWRRR